MRSRQAPSSAPVLLATGAAGGIGAAVVALARARDDRTVVGWDTVPARRADGSADGDLAVVDVTDPAAVDAALDALERDVGPVSALIHTAGVLDRDDPLAPDPATWERMLRVNTLGTVTVCSAVAARMAGGSGGTIVAVTSNAASTPRVDMAAYAASKAAAASYVRSLGLRVGDKGVRCNTVSPGSTLTPMLTGGWGDDDGDRADRTAALVAGTPSDHRLGIPLGRVADPDDIAHACLWLASDEARHVTLHDLRVDGGATLDAR